MQRAMTHPPSPVIPAKAGIFLFAFLRKMDCLVAALLAITLLATPALADQKGDCGTIIIPTGLGVASGADVTSLNPLLSNSTYNLQAGDLMYLGLIWINRFAQIDWSRSLASAIATPDQGTTYNVTLRPWHWSDGVPVTTADIAYTFKLIKELGSTYPGYGAGGMPDIIKSLNIISPTQFQVVLKRQVNSTWFIYNGLGQLLPLPDQIWQNQSTPAFYNVVDGPLKTQSLDIGLDLAMVPNQAYEGPQMHFEKLVFKFIESDGATLQAVEAGDVDMADVPFAVWNAVQHLPGIYIVKLPPAFSWNYITLNFRNPQVAFFKDVRIRDAMQDALNQAAMVKYVQHGLGVEVLGPVPPVPPTFLSPQMRAGIYPVGYNPAKARALLEQAGYTPGPDGVMQKNGQRLSFVFLLLTGDDFIQEMTEEIQAEFRAVGIEMKVREIEFNQLLALLDSGSTTSWQAAGLGTSTGGYPTGEDFFTTGGYDNSGGYSDPTMDKLIAESTDKPGLDGLFAYENYASAQQPVIFFATSSIAVLVRNRIHGMADFINPAFSYSPEQLYCTPERTAQN
jgi:peptide/nickel transport system substrate-binding protein